MWTSQLIEDAAAALAAQLVSGLPIADVCRTMRRLQPVQAEFWDAAATRCANGSRLSESLQEAWPEYLVQSIRAGEDSGTQVEVYRIIVNNMKREHEVKKVFSKIYSPIFISIGGLAVLFFFAGMVVPSLAKSVQMNGNGPIAQLVHQMSVVAGAIWLPVVGGLVAGMGYLIYWLRSTENFNIFMASLAFIPPARKALLNIYYANWASIVMLQFRAGLDNPIADKLAFAAKVIPENLRDGAMAMSQSIRSESMERAANSEVFAAGDQRWDIPPMILNAFTIAHNTGCLDDEIERIIPGVTEQGVKIMTALCSSFNTLAIVFAAVLSLSPMMLYFASMGEMVTQMR